MDALKRWCHKVLAVTACLAGQASSAQCPLLFDYWGTPSGSPQWYSCQGTPYTLLIASPQAIGPYTVDWGDGSPIQSGGGLVPPMSITHGYPSTVGQYTITFTETSTGCVITGTLTVEESTSASIQIPVGGLTQICAPQAVDFINSSTNVSPNTVFTWDFGDSSPLLVVDHTNLGQTVSHTYLPGTVGCETTVRLYAENTCNTLQGGASQATFNPIRIWDLDTAQITPSATLLCWPDNVVTFLNTSRRNCLNQGNIYQRFEYWNFGDYWGAGHDSIINWTPWPPTFPRTIAYPGIGTYEVMLLDSNYCGIDTARITITIVPPPTVTLSATPDTICAGETVFFTQTTSGGANYFQWDLGTGNGFQWTGAGNQAHTYHTPGTYLVSYTASIQGATAGCADTASVPVVVLPSPVAQFTMDQDAACDSLTVSFTNTSVGGISHMWDFGDGTFSTAIQPPPHFYGTAGTYTVTLTVTNTQGCQSTATHDVNVYAPPTVVIDAQNVCEGVPAQFTDLTVTAPGNPVVQWDWDFGDGNTSTLQAPSHLYAASMGYTVTLTVHTPYCSGTGTRNVLVEAKPDASFTLQPAIGCSPLPVQFMNTSTGAVSYAWSFGDGNSSTTPSPTHTFVNPGPGDSVFTIQLIASTLFGCADTAQATVTVAPPVVAAFAHNGLPGCAPMDVQFTNLSSGAGSYLWDFGDGNTSTAAAPTHQYVNNGLLLQINTVTLTAISAAGCTSTVTQTILVFPTPDFSFVAQPDSGCSPLTVTFPAIAGAVTYNWDFGDGSTGAGPAPTHVYLNNGPTVAQYPVMVYGANAFGCVDTAYGQVTVFPNPVADLSVTGGSGCHPLTATLQNNSQGATTYLWSYGDGQTSTITAPAHDHTWYNFLGTGPVSYPITLTATNDHGCAGTTTASVQVHPVVNAQFVVDTVGCSPLTVQFTNVTSGASTYLWQFGDGAGSAQASPTHTYQNQGLADVTFNPMLVATSVFGCVDTADASILVHPAPIAQFVPGVLAGCQPLPVGLQDLSIGATQLTWLFGDGTTQTGAPGNTNHTYTHGDPTPVNFPITLIGTSIHGCTDTAHAQVQVYPAVIADFTVPPAGCSPMLVEPMDQSVGANTYLWDMGNGITLVGPTPSYTYVNGSAGNQTWPVTLTVTSPYGCVSTAVRTITVHPMPFASFMATPFTQQFPASTVTILNTTPPGPWTHQWAMGDGATSNQQQPGQHTYATWGQYTIMLVVTDGLCTDTASQQIMITSPVPTASFTGGGEGCAPLTVSFTNTSLLAQGYLWNFGDGGQSTADDPVYTYTVPGTYPVTLTAYGPGGAINTYTLPDAVVVHPRATAFFVLQPTEVIVPSQPVFMYNLSSNASTYAWDFGDGNTSTVFNPVHYYTGPGSFDVTLIANNQWNCPDTFTLNGAVRGETAGELQFPNAFTPGNTGPTDGYYDPQSFDNDWFFPVYSGVEDYRLQVFNRWGELVFESVDIRRGWDGYYRGRPAKQDVYAWKAWARFSDGREQVLTGDVTLLR